MNTDKHRFVYQEITHKMIVCALEVLGVRTIPVMCIFIFFLAFFNNPFQAGHETNNTLKNIRVNSCSFVVKKDLCPSVV
ncbi:MAG: hypothetical protein CR997_11145 [Acidobacteria bacterium]|nr:MAG: hypothetical protein CR997_11145 [Acidobacteriota bacterium]